VLAAAPHLPTTLQRRLMSARVEGDRSVRPVMLGERHTGVEDVDRGGGGPDERRLEQRDEAGDVGAHIGNGVDERVVHTGLHDEVEDMASRSQARRAASATSPSTT
jgi:hypothetical protein